MPFAGGIAIIAIGAILTFALTGSVKGIDLDVVGVILILAGASGILFPLLMARRSRTRRPAADTSRTEVLSPEQGLTEELPRYDPTPGDERQVPEEPRPWTRPGRA